MDVSVYLGRTFGGSVVGFYGPPRYHNWSLLLILRWDTRERFVPAVRSALDQTGLVSSNYAGHSFPSGAATTAVIQGIQNVKTLGRWESSVYVKTPRETVL